MNVENNLKTLPMLRDHKVPMEKAALSQSHQNDSGNHDDETVAVERNPLAKALFLGSVLRPILSAAIRENVAAMSAGAQSEKAMAHSSEAVISGASDNSKIDAKNEHVDDVLSAFADDINGMGQGFGLDFDALNSIEQLNENAASATLDDYRHTLSQVPPGTELQDYSVAQMEAYNQLHKAFMQTHGVQVLESLVVGQHLYGVGEAFGEGSGAATLMWRQEVVLSFEKFVNQGMENGQWEVPELDPTRPAPDNLGQASPFDPVWPDQVGNDATVERPDFLLINGDSATPFILDGKAHESLEDFSSLDDLGRAIGQTYQAEHSLHDPTSLSWNGEVGSVVKEWLTTENGKAWAENHPQLASLWIDASELPTPPPKPTLSAPS